MTNFMIAEPILWEKIHETYGCSSGIYKLRSLMPAPENNRYFAITRIAGIDEEVILYIGASEHIKYRLTILKKAVCSAFGFT